MNADSPGMLRLEKATLAATAEIEVKFRSRPWPNGQLFNLRTLFEV
jgi:hypothetical protein